MAFLLAAVAAALAALVSVLQSRTFHRVLQQGVDSVPAAVQALRPTRGARATTIALRPGLLHRVNGAVLSPVARSAIHVGANVVDIANRDRRRSFDRIKSMTAAEAQRARAALRSIPQVLRSTTGKLVRTASAGRSGARAALAAIMPRLWQVREKWALHQQRVAPYLFSLALAVVVGWAIGTH